VAARLRGHERARQLHHEVPSGSSEWTRCGGIRVDLLEDVGPSRAIIATAPSRYIRGSADLRRANTVQITTIRTPGCTRFGLPGQGAGAILIAGDAPEAASAQSGAAPGVSDRLPLRFRAV